MLVLTIGGKRVLNQVIRSDGQEFGLVGEQICDDRRAGCFDHGAQGNVAVVLEPFFGQLVAYLGADLAHDPPFANARNQGEHDAQRSDGGGAVEGAQLRTEEVAAPQRIADGTQSEGRVVAGRNAH